MKVYKNQVLELGGAKYQIIKQIGLVTFLVKKSLGESMVKRRLRKRYLLCLIKAERKRK